MAVVHDKPAAEAITAIDTLLEVIVAPNYDEDALTLLRSRWKNVRLLAVGGDGAVLHEQEGAGQEREGNEQQRRGLAAQPERDRGHA